MVLLNLQLSRAEAEAMLEACAEVPDAGQRAVLSGVRERLGIMLEEAARPIGQQGARRVD